MNGLGVLLGIVLRIGRTFLATGTRCQYHGKQCTNSQSNQNTFHKHSDVKIVNLSEVKIIKNFVIKNSSLNHLRSFLTSFHWSMPENYLI